MVLMKRENFVLYVCGWAGLETGYGNQFWLYRCVVLYPWLLVRFDVNFNLRCHLFLFSNAFKSLILFSHPVLTLRLLLRTSFSLYLLVVGVVRWSKSSISLDRSTLLSALADTGRSLERSRTMMGMPKSCFCSGSYAHFFIIPSFWWV